MSAPKIVIEMIGGNCPVQAEGTLNGAVFYFRARGSRWSLSVATDKTGACSKTAWYYEEGYGDKPFSAGWMREDEALGFIAKAAAIYAEAHPE